MEATKTRATFSAKHHTNNAATQYTIRASRKIIGTIWSPCEVWNNSHSDEYQITVNVAPGYTLKSYAPTLDEAIAEFDRLTDGKYNIDTKGIAATPTETPQIPTETAETVNVSAEGENAENEPIKHISEIMETCRTWDDEKRDYTDEYKYYTWLANHIPEHKATNKNTTELILEEVRERISAAATLAAHGVPKCDIEGAVCAVVNRLAKMEDILQFYNHKEPPQSPVTPQTVECTTDTPKPRETALKRQNRAIGSAQTTRRDTLRDTLRHVTYVPRECSTANAPPYW